MGRSQVRTLIGMLCIAALLGIVIGCEEQAAKQPKAQPEKTMKPAAEKAPAASAKPAAAAKTEVAKPAEAAKGSGPYKFTSNWMDEQGFVSQWLVVGPFPNPGTRPDENGITIDYLGGELTYNPASGMEVKKADGSMLKWQQYISTSPEINFFSIESLKLEPSQENILVYAACWLDSDSDKDVEVRIGSDDGYKLFINHKQIAEENVYRSMEMDQETYKVKLNKGKNLILIKVTQDYGEFSFEMRVVGSDGKAVPGISIWN
jgi:hypothetical protein